MTTQKNTAHEGQVRPRMKLEKTEISQIKSEIYLILANNNLLIRQSKDVLLDVIAGLDECRPWDHSQMENNLKAYEAMRTNEAITASDFSRLQETDPAAGRQPVEQP